MTEMSTGRIWSLPLHTAFIFVCVSILLGCHAWRINEQTHPQLPRPRMSRDGVGLEIASFMLPVEASQLVERLERELDEQLMSAELRRRLVANGLRIGRYGSQLPAEVRELLAAEAEARRNPTSPLRNDYRPERFVQVRTGHRKEIPVAPRRAEMTAHHVDGNGVVHDKSLRDARCLFAFRCFPRGASGTDIELTPEIEHGPVRQKYIARDGDFQLEAGREYDSFDELTMTVSLRPGETLLLTCSPQKNNLGRSFFVDTETKQQRVLLIRLAQTQLTDLFGDEP